MGIAYFIAMSKNRTQVIIDPDISYENDGTEYNFEINDRYFKLLKVVYLEPLAQRQVLVLVQAQGKKRKTVVLKLSKFSLKVFKAIVRILKTDVLEYKNYIASLKNNGVKIKLRFATI